MREIRMVDLKSQYQRIKPEIDAAIQDVIDSAQFIKGPAIGKFEKELADFLNCNHVVACGNCTDALQISLMALGLKPGDEVITTPFSFISTIEVIRLLQLTPVLVDINQDTFNIDPVQIEKAITKNTKVIIPVHLFGQCAEMKHILDLAQNHHLFVIEDTAQALGADYLFSNGSIKKAGTMGKAGCTSFFPSKNLGCYGDGGAVFTNDDHFAEKLRSIANHGMKVKYYYEEVGVNSRMDTIQAAILRIKLNYLEDFNKARQKAAAYYDNAFELIPQIKTPFRADYSTHIFHQYTIILYGRDRNLLKEHLKSKNIPSMIYYPVPLHLQTAYKNLNYGQGDFPVSEELSNNVLSLPMHSELDEIQLEYITREIIGYVKKSKQHG